MAKTAIPTLLLAINTQAHTVLFRDKGGNVMRIRNNGGLLEFKSAQRMTTAEGEISVQMVGNHIRLTDGNAPIFLKLLTKAGFADGSPFFSFTKGAGGWYNITHDATISNMPKLFPVLKAEVRGNLIELGKTPKVAIATKKEKPAAKTKPAKRTAAHMDPAPTAAEPVMEDFHGYEQRVIADAAIIVAANDRSKSGRPSNELVNAQTTIMRFSTLYNRTILGGIDLRAILKTIDENIAGLTISKLALEAAINQQENIAEMAAWITAASKEAEPEEPVAEADIIVPVADVHDEIELPGEDDIKVIPATIENAGVETTAENGAGDRIEEPGDERAAHMATASEPVNTSDTATVDTSEPGTQVEPPAEAPKSELPGLQTLDNPNKTTGSKKAGAKKLVKAA